VERFGYGGGGKRKRFRALAVAEDVISEEAAGSVFFPASGDRQAFVGFLAFEATHRFKSVYFGFLLLRSRSC
jgi:hypothetical protein